MGEADARDEAAGARRDSTLERARAEHVRSLWMLASWSAAIAIVTAVLGYAWLRDAGTFRCGARQAEFRRVMEALELYRFDHGSYPSTLTALETETCSCGERYCDPVPLGTWHYDPAPNVWWSYTLWESSHGSAAHADLPIEAWRELVRRRHRH